MKACVFAAVLLLAGCGGDDGQTYADDYRGAQSQYWITVEEQFVVTIDEQYRP
jgi:hypothetical protein